MRAYLMSYGELLNSSLRDPAEIKCGLPNLRAPAGRKGLGTRRGPLGQPILLGGGTQRFRDVLAQGFRRQNLDVGSAVTTSW